MEAFLSRKHKFVSSRPSTYRLPILRIFSPCLVLFVLPSSSTTPCRFRRHHVVPTDDYPNPLPLVNFALPLPSIINKSLFTPGRNNPNPHFFPTCISHPPLITRGHFMSGPPTGGVARPGTVGRSTSVGVWHCHFGVRVPAARRFS